MAFVRSRYFRKNSIEALFSVKHNFRFRWYTTILLLDMDSSTLLLSKTIISKLSQMYGIQGRVFCEAAYYFQYFSEWNIAHTYGYNIA